MYRMADENATQAILAHRFLQKRHENSRNPVFQVIPSLPRIALLTKKIKGAAALAATPFPSFNAFALLVRYLIYNNRRKHILPFHFHGVPCTTYLLCPIQLRFRPFQNAP